MAEPADQITTTTSPPQPESENSTTTMSAAIPTDPTSQEEASKDTDLTKQTESEKKPGGISLRIWPPTQKTREAVLNRLIETLSTESILSKRYGTLKSDEANTVAKLIEEEAYEVASNAVLSDDDGIKILELYSKEISKRMLESVKARVGNGNESVDDVSVDATEVSNDDSVPVSEDKSEA